MNIDEQVERQIHDYMVTLHLFKALQWDRKKTGSLKMERVWIDFIDRLADAAEREHLSVKRSLRRAGCRIVLEELTAQRDVHIMYVYRGYEHHCTMMPAVLKGRCEDKLRQLAPSTLNCTIRRIE